MAEPFRNDPIPTDHLPRLSDDAFVSVDPRYVRVSLTGIALTALLVAVGGGFITTQAESATVALLITLGILIVLALSAVYRITEVRRLAYQLREHDVSMRSGVITHRVETLPFSRVQHVNINRGPVERSIGLSTLHISSAGPDINIPGLSAADAERIKLLVTERAGALDDDDTDASVPPSSPAAPDATTPTPPSPTPPPPPTGPAATSLPPPTT